MRHSLTIITITQLEQERLDYLIKAAESVVSERLLSGWFDWVVVVNGKNCYSEIPQLVVENARIILTEKTGVSTRNMALLDISTDFVTTLDDDDILLPYSVINRMRSLEGRNSWVAGHMSDVIDGVVGSSWEQPLVSGRYNSGGVVELWGSPSEWFVAITHSFILPTRLVKIFGGWVEQDQEDILLVSQVTSVVDGSVIPESVVGYRRHDTQISRNEHAVETREVVSKGIFDQVSLFV